MPSLDKKYAMASASARNLVNQTNLSFTSKRDYKRILDSCIKTLHKEGFILSDIKQLKQKHVRCLVNQFKESQLSLRSIKNKLSVLRLTCQVMRKTDVVLDNNVYELPPPIPKSDSPQRAIHEIDLSEFEHPNIRFSVALQKEFGLRREEALKFDVSKADKGDHILLQASWTKGGIERDVSITTGSQRALLDEIKEFCPKSSLIPKEDSYIAHRRRYDEAVRNSNYNNLHGLRHAYAQRRYQVLTGMPCPNQGGKHHKDMTGSEKDRDHEARSIISIELGHSRISITKIYCG